jgi:Arc/MetJ-type ribon-helix-helix transcriptional regulator
MPAKYRRIHMPKPLHDEIVKFVENSEYETVAELCREAGRLLVEHHKLRERHG